MYELDEIKKRSLASIIFYLIIYLIIGSVLTLLLIKIYSNDTYDYETILKALGAVSGDEKLDLIATKINTFSMVLIYLPLSLILITVMHKDFKEDYIKSKERRLFTVLFIVLGGLAFWGFSMLLSYSAGRLAGENSENEEVLESVFKYKKYGAMMLLVTSICGPIVEEVVYRKSIFNLLSEKPRWVPILVSTVFFALPHIITTTGVSVGNFIIISIPYFAAGAILAFAYEYSGRNIYVTMGLHFINNFLVCLLLLV